MKKTTCCNNAIEDCNCQEDFPEMEYTDEQLFQMHKMQLPMLREKRRPNVQHALPLYLRWN
jgi:hypothetical protein